MSDNHEDLDPLVKSMPASMSINDEVVVNRNITVDETGMRHVKPAVAAIFILSLAACAGTTITEYVSYDVTGVPNHFRYAASGRDFRTEIHGNPSAVPKAAFDAAVVAAMQGKTRGTSTNFSLTPSASMRDGYRVVMVFSGDRLVGGAAACREVDAGALAPVTERVELQAAFCFEERVLSQAHVRFASFSDPQDPGLDSAVSQAVLHLFPRRDLTMQPDQSDRDPIIDF